MATPSLYTDEELAARSMKGDKEAFADLYERHFDRVYDFVLRLTRNEAEAADVAQDTFMKLLSGQSPRPPQVSFKAWLMTVARNATIDRVRRDRRLEAMPEVETEEEQEPAFHHVAAVPDASPEQSAMSEELASLVWQAARGLNASEYALLDLNLRQHLEPDEIAQALGTSRGNVYTMLSRLRDALEEAVTALLLVRRGRRECSEVDAILTKMGAEGELTPRVRRAISRHAAGCATCGTNRRRYASAAELFGALIPVLPSPALKAEVFSRLADALPASAAPAAPGTEGTSATAATGGQAGPATGAAATQAAAKAGFWASLSLPVKAMVVAGAGLVVAGGAAVGAMAAWGSSQVHLENSNCPAFTVPSEGLLQAANSLPIFEVPQSPIGPGAVGTLTLPSGKVQLDAASSSIRFRGYGMEVTVPLPGVLQSMQWDGGEELLGKTSTLELSRGSSHTLRLVCR